ncbi:hypothetical protein JCM1841_003181, partial [Sporobolomyces salmonicolor]
PLPADPATKTPLVANPAAPHPIGAGATNQYEGAASTVQPESYKSMPQKAADETTESRAQGPDTRKSTTEKVKEKLHLGGNH